MEKIKQFKDLIVGDTICEWSNNSRGISVIKTYTIDRVIDCDCEKLPNYKELLCICLKNELGMLSHMYLNKLDLFNINNGVLVFPESSKEFLISILNFGIAEGGKYCYNRFRELENDLREEFNINIEEE